MTFKRNLVALFTILLAFTFTSFAAKAADVRPVVKDYLGGYFSEVNDAGRHYFKIKYEGIDLVFEITKGSVSGKDHEANQTLLSCLALKADLADANVTNHKLVYKDSTGRTQHFELGQVPKADGFGRPVFKEPVIKKYDCSSSKKYYAEG